MLSFARYAHNQGIIIQNHQIFLWLVKQSCVTILYIAELSTYSDCKTNSTMLLLDLTSCLKLYCKCGNVDCISSLQPLDCRHWTFITYTTHIVFTRWANYKLWKSFSLHKLCLFDSSNCFIYFTYNFILLFYFSYTVYAKWTQLK